MTREGWVNINTTHSIRQAKETLQHKTSKRQLSTLPLGLMLYTYADRHLLTFP